MPTITIEQVPEGQRDERKFIARIPTDPQTRVIAGTRDLVMRVAALHAHEAWPNDEITFVDVPWVYRPEEDVKPVVETEEPQS